MIKKLKNSLSILLVLILITPMLGQFFDGVFHEHHKEEIATQAENHFSHFHKKCPIPDFQLSLFSLQKLSEETKKQSYTDFLIAPLPAHYLSDKSKFSFLLRAPPSLA